MKTVLFYKPEQLQIYQTEMSSTHPFIVFQCVHILLIMLDFLNDLGNLKSTVDNSLTSYQNS